MTEAGAALDAWLDPDADAATLHALLQPREWPDLSARPVSNGVNRASSDGAGLVAPLMRAMPRLL